MPDKVWIAKYGSKTLGVYTSKELAVSESQKYLQRMAASARDFRIQRLHSKINEQMRQMSGNQIADAARNEIVASLYGDIDAVPPLDAPPAVKEYGASTDHPSGTTRVGDIYINSYPLIDDEVFIERIN